MVRIGRVGHAPAGARGRSLGLALLTAAVLLGACSGPPIPATPQPATGVFTELAILGGSTPNLVSGDPGCNQPDMIPYAIHAQVRVPANASQLTDVYLFTWADHGSWSRGAVAFDSCRAEYAASRSAAGRTVDELDVSPYRAFGAGWSPALKSALQQAMTEAAGNGG